MSDESYVNIRVLLGELIGEKLVEITQHDSDYFARTGRCFVDLMFKTGNVLRFYVEGQGLCLNPNDETEAKRFGDDEEE